MQDTLLFFFITIAFWFDIRQNRIPNWLTSIAAAFGLLFHLLVDGWKGAFFSVFGLVIGFSALIVLYVIDALGAGDVKLFASVGAIGGSGFVIESILYSLIFAGLMGLLFLVFNRNLF